MNQFITAVLTSLSSGAIYALMSISLVLVWRSTRVVNFAQAGQAVFTTFIGYEVTIRTGSYWVGLFVAVICGGLVGAIIDRFFMRPIFKRVKSGPIVMIAPVVATLGLLGLIQSVIGFIWGHGDVLLEAPLSKIGYKVGETTLFVGPMGLFVIAFVVTLLIVVTIVFQKTNIGLALRASAYAPEIAQLSGIRVSGIRTLGWAIAGASGAAAGILQTVNGTGVLTPESLEFSLLLVFGFIAAVIGGLESLPGAVLGSLILGLVLAFVQIYISGTLVFIVAFLLLLTLLIIRPQGFLGSKAGRRA